MIEKKYDDFAFSIPDEWVDRTIVSFSAPVGKKSKFAPNIVVTKDILDDIKPMEEYVDKQLVDLASQMEKFNLLKRNKITIDSLSAVELSYTWSGTNGTIQQSQVFVIVGKKMITFTATSFKDDFPLVAPVFQMIANSMKFPSNR